MRAAMKADDDTKASLDDFSPRQPGPYGSWLSSKAHQIEGDTELIDTSSIVSHAEPQRTDSSTEHITSNVALKVEQPLPQELLKMEKPGSSEDSPAMSKDSTPQLPRHLSKSSSMSLSASDMKKRKAQEAKALEPFTKHVPFQIVIGLVIMANAVCMTIEADDEDGDHAAGLEAMEHFFAAAFVLEFALRIKCEGWWEYYRHPANCLDFCLVLLAVLDVWIIKPAGLDKNVDLGSASLLRMLRLLKLGRLLKLFHMFQELTVILQSLVAGCRVLFWAAIFMLLFLYLFAMIGTLNFGGDPSCDEPVQASLRLLKGASGAGATAQTGGDGEAGENPKCKEFSSVGRSLLTLWLCLTEGCGDSIMKPMVLETPVLMIFWLIFIFIGSFGMLNIIIGLFCESVIEEAAKAEKEMAAMQDELRKEQMKRLRDLFELTDKDGDGTITSAEWCAAMEKPEVADILQEVGLEEESDLYAQLDVDNSGEIEFDEFFDGLMLIVKGSDNSKARDGVPTFLTCQLMRKRINALSSNVENLDAKISTNVHALQANIDNLHTTINSVNDKVDALCDQMQKNHVELMKTKQSI